MRSLAAAVTALTLSSACGGPPSNKALGDLSEREREELCQALAVDEPMELTCEDQDGTVTVTFGQTYDECVEGMPQLAEGCEATVGDAADCNEAQIALYEEYQDDPCAYMENQGFPEECAPVFECIDFE